MPLFMKVFALLGWQRILTYSWRLAKPQLEKAAKKTETSFDEDAIKVVDEILTKVLSDKAL